jgi:hypothetical protein
MKRVWTTSLFVVACASASSTTTTPYAEPSASKSATCADEYAQIESNWASYTPKEQATSPFKHCPHWHRAMPEACGTLPQPSFIEPCHCMCDLCDHDSDCGPGASCVTMSSVICGGYEERVCVRADDPCHPNNVKRTCPTYCVTRFGKPQCISREDRRGCDR